MKRNKKAFTLIELLIAILLIGVLAAVAVPQYQKSILKARLAEYEGNFAVLEQAFLVCELGKGEPCSINEMDIEVPNCTPIPSLFSSCYYDIFKNTEKNARLVIRNKEGKALFSYFPMRESLGHKINQTFYSANMSGMYCTAEGLTSTQCAQLGFTEFVIYSHYKRSIN